MKTNLEQLLSIASAAIGDDFSELPPNLWRKAGLLGDQLQNLLTQKNGFFAFENALHVFPVGTVADGFDLETWNADASWISNYGDLAQGFLFFAEDIFGGQFGIKDNTVYRFDPETGEAEEMATSLEDWAHGILTEYEVETGYPLAKEWQETHGSLLPDERLIPKTPFVMGGDFEIANLYKEKSLTAMRLRGELALQIINLPDGSKINYKTSD